MERSSLNSGILQQTFPDVYQDFFGKCSIVFSTSLSFNWIEDFAKRYRGISITQKLPFKTYVGIELTNEQSLEFGDLFQYQPLLGKFEVNSLERTVYPIPDVQKYLNRMLHKIAPDSALGGKIHCLTELPLAHGYSFSGNFSSLVSALTYLMAGRLTEDQIEQWEKFSPMELLQNPDLMFNEVFYTAWDINYILKYGDSSGAGAFASLVSGFYPIITFPAKTIRSRDYASIKNNFFTGLGKLPFWGYRLNDLYKDFDSSPFWPIDMGVMFSGKPCISERIAQKIDNDFNQYEDLKSHFRNVFKDDIEKAPLLPDFYENCILIDETIVNKYHDLYSVLSLMMIRQFHRLLLHGYNEREVDKFVGTVSKRYFASNMLDEASQYMSEFLLKLNTSVLQGKAFSRVGFFNTNNIQLGGGVGFVTSPQLNRMNLMTVFSEMRRNFPNMSVDYVSWLDGYGESGLKIEQNLSSKKYSAFIDSSSFLLCSYIGKIKSQTIVNGNVVEGLGKKYDMLCNMMDNTIMIGGKVISSSDLHSQKATVTLLSRLLEKKNEEVSCKEFPRSSYSQNKNEMQGKIVLPLMKLIKQRTHKNLGLTCKGSNTDFYLKLTLKEDQRIGVINNFQESE